MSVFNHMFSPISFLIFQFKCLITNMPLFNIQRNKNVAKNALEYQSKVEINPCHLIRRNCLHHGKTVSGSFWSTKIGLFRVPQCSAWVEAQSLLIYQLVDEEVIQSLVLVALKEWSYVLFRSSTYLKNEL